MTLQHPGPRPQPHRPTPALVLDSFEGLRVTDVCDGMDALGMHDMGQMSRDIRPLWRDTDTFAHRIYGLAHTVRFVPTQRPVPDQTPDEFYDWMRNWYDTLARGPFVDQIRPRRPHRDRRIRARAAPASSAPTTRCPGSPRGRSGW